MSQALSAAGSMAAATADLVAANRILAHENVCDAYGHVSVRDPEDGERFLLSCSRSPELVEAADIMRFTFDGATVGDDPRPPYMERFIHGAIYAARPDVQAVVHSHAEDTLAFGITGQPLIPVVHSAGCLGKRIPTWDIRERFGAGTNLLVMRTDHGRDLAERLGDARVVLMRGHGFAVAAPSLYEAVKIAVYLPRNARVLTTALRFGGVVALSEGEIEQLSSFEPDAPASRRAWQYWCARAGVR